MPTLRSLAVQNTDAVDVQTPSLLLTTRNIQPLDIRVDDSPILFDASEGDDLLAHTVTSLLPLSHNETSATSHPITSQDSLVRHIKFFKADMFGKLSCPIPRCQDLPQDCFGVPGAFDVVVAVSHGWRNQSHPDPLGKKQSYLQSLLNVIIEKMERRQVYLFFDFLSLSQRPFAVGQETRSLEEDLEFAKALQCMHNVYFHADFIIHLPWGDYTIDGEESEYIVEASELRNMHCERIGTWMQVVEWPLYPRCSDTSKSSTNKSRKKRVGSVRDSPKAFDRIISIQGMGDSLEDLQSFIATNGKAEVRLRRYPFGRINQIHTDDRGWIFLERFINMVKCAMLDPAQAQQIVITSSEDISSKIRNGADRLRQAVQRDSESPNQNSNSEDVSNLDTLLNEFLADLSTKKFSSVSFDKQENGVEISGDELVVKTIMTEFVTHLKAHWHREVAGQRKRLGKIGAAMMNYLTEWNSFSIHYIAELRVVSTADPTPIALLFLVTLATPFFVILVPLDPPDFSWENQLHFFFGTLPYVTLFASNILCALWMGLMRNSLNRRTFLWVLVATVVSTSAMFGLATILDNFPIPFCQVCMCLCVSPLLPVLWWCIPLAQRAQAGFVKRALCTMVFVASIMFAFGAVCPLLNSAMKHMNIWFSALLLTSYLLMKLFFIQLGETMVKWLGSDTMPIFVFYSNYAYEYNLCQALAGGFHPLHFCMLMAFDTVENVFHLWSLYRQGQGTNLQQNLGKAQYIVVGLLLRELCEVMVPLQFLLQFVLMRKVQRRFNHSACVTEDEFQKAVLYLCLEIGIEVLVGAGSFVCLKGASFEPFKMLRGLVAMNLPMYISGAGGASVFLLFCQHSHSGADMNFQFPWFGDARWECGLSWIAE